jgi:hypothetical protein
MKRSQREAAGVDNVETNPRPNKKIKLASLTDFFLPDTLRIILKSKLDEKSQRRARLVCKQWFNIIDQSVFNIGALHRTELPQVVDVLSRYKKPISVRFKNLQRCNSTDIVQISRLTNLTSLGGDFKEEELDIIVTSLTDLHTLTLSKSNVSTSIFTILKNLKSLSCGRLTGELTDLVPQLRDLTIISHPGSILRISVPGAEDLFIPAYELCKFPNLESLIVRKGTPTNLPPTLTRLEFHSSISNWEEFQREIQHLTRLKLLVLFESVNDISPFPNLEALHTPFFFDNNLSAPSKLTALKMIVKRVPSSVEMSSLTRLVELEFRLGKHVPNLDLSIFSSLVHLTSLRMTELFDTTLFNYESLTCLTDLLHLTIDLLISTPFTHYLTTLTSLKLKLEPNQGDRRKKQKFSKLTKLQQLRLEFGAYTQLRDVIETGSFDTLTLLTRLTLDMVLDDDDWNQITKLTNLIAYKEEYGSVGDNRDRFADLTALKHLTSLLSADNGKSNYQYLSTITTLQLVALYDYGESHDVDRLIQHLPFCTRKIT